MAGGKIDQDAYPPYASRDPGGSRAKAGLPGERIVFGRSRRNGRGGAGSNLPVGEKAALGGRISTDRPPNGVSGEAEVVEDLYDE